MLTKCRSELTNHWKIVFWTKNPTQIKNQHALLDFSPGREIPWPAHAMPAVLKLNTAWPAGINVARCNLNPPPPACRGVSVQDSGLNSCTILTTREKPSKSHTPGADPPPKHRRLANNPPQIAFLQIFSSTFCRSRTVQKTTFSKASQNHKNEPEVAKGFNLALFWMTWHRFPINFPDRLNLLICNTYNANTSFLQFQASHFGIPNKLTSHVFSNPLIGPHVSHVFQFVQKLVDLGTRSKSNGGQIGTNIPPSGANTQKIEITGRPQNAFLMRPRRQLKRPGSHFWWFLKNVESFQAPFWTISNVSWHRFLY